MIDADAYREKLIAYGEDKVRRMVAEGRIANQNASVARAWLEEQEGLPVKTRPSPERGLSSLYEPTEGDLRYRDAFTTDPDIDPFHEAMLLEGISSTYLGVLVSDNCGERSAGFKAMLDNEIARRSSLTASRANRIALGSLAVSVIAIGISIFA